MVQAIVIPANDSEPIEPRDLRTLEDYQAEVGGWIEHVDIPDIGVTLAVNENGIAQALPFNRRATFFWWFHQGYGRGRVRLVGNVVLEGLDDTDDNPTDVPAAIAELLLVPGEFAVEARCSSGMEWRSDPSLHPSYVEAVVWACMVKELSEASLELRITRTAGEPASEPPS
tara:strand:+ start:1015 stop:1527 length:513 start_codon:yes stop_codon:yes gene_type:complete